MEKLRNRAIVIVSSICFLCAVVFATSFAFAGENAMEKIQEALRNLCPTNDIVAQDVYGVFQGEYATAQTKVNFEGGEDTSVDVVKTDGTVLFHTSTAETKVEGNPVWSDYSFTRIWVSTEYPVPYFDVGKNLKDDNFTTIKNKSTKEFGAIDRDGNVVVDVSYDRGAGQVGNLYYGVSSNGEQNNFDIIDKDSKKHYGTISASKEGNSISKIGQYYSVNSGVFFKIDNGKMVIIEGVKSLFNNSFNENVVIVTNDNKVQVLKPDGSRIDIAQLQSNNWAQYKGFFITYFEGSQKYFTESGVDVTSKISGELRGQVSKYSYSYDSGSNTTYFYDKDANLINQLSGDIPKASLMQDFDFGNNRICLCNKSGQNVSIDLYNQDFTFYKNLKTTQLPEGATISSYGVFTQDTSVFSGYGLSMFYVEKGKTESKVFYYDKSWNEVSESDATVSYKMKDGTSVYVLRPTEIGGKNVYVDVNGNKIVRNGYTLNTHTEEIFRYLCNRVQHANDDIWWATNAEGKYGAIDSYGNVIVPFVYEKQCDLGLEGNDTALCYKDGVWETVNLKDAPEPKPEPKVDSTTANSITLSWDAVPGAQKYAVATQNDDGKSYTTYTSNLTDTTYTITGLEDSKTYKCLVQAYVNGKWTSFSDTDLVQATTKGTRPVVTATQTGDGEVTLTWEAIEGAEKYVAYEVIGSSYVQIGDILPAGTLTVKKDNLANDYEHTFLVQAQVDGTWSKFSENNYAYATPKGTVKPTLNTPTVTGTTINLSWNKVPGASCYAVATKIGDSKYTTYTLTEPSTSYSIKGLEDGVTYDCLVQANINGKWSSFDDSDLQQATTKGTRPVVTATPSGDGEVTLTWEAIEGAEKYVAYEVIGSSYVQIGDILPAGTLTVKKDNLANDYEHTFLVQAQVDGTWSKFSENNYAKATPTGTTKPTLNTPTVTGTTINLSWNKVPGASAYAVATKIGDSKYTTYTLTEPSTSYSIKGLEDGVTYDCLVQANINGKWSSFDDSDLVQATTKGTRPVVTATQTGDGEVTLTWEAIEGAEKYVAYEVIGSSYVQIGDIIPAGTLTVKKDNLANDYEHTFLVQAQVDGTWSKFSENNYAKATPTGTVKPTLETPTVTGTTINLSWNKVPGASAYAVATKVGDSKYTTYTMTETSTNYSIKGLEDGVTYDCLVQANINGKWSSFDDSDLQQATTKGTRPVVTATPSGDGEVTLTWEAIEGAEKYVAYEVIGSSYVQIGDIIPAGTLTVKKDNLANDYEHTFLVQAQVDGTWSKFSENNYAKATPTGTTKPTTKFISSTDTTVTLGWNSVPGAEKYAVAVRDNSGVYHTVYAEPNQTSATITGLTPNTNYKGLVQCQIYGKWSAYTEADHVDAKTDRALSAVAVYSTKDASNPTLTFYYDKKDHATEGTVYSVPNTYGKVEIPGWNPIMHTVKTVKFDSSFIDFKPWSTMYWFDAWRHPEAHESNLETFIGIDNLNTSLTERMDYMFFGCGKLKSIDLSHFDTSNVEYMTAMFNGCSDLASLDLSSFNTSNVINMTGMFFGCSGLTSLDLSNFNTSKVHDMALMFDNCSKLASLDLSSFNTSNVETMVGMFSYCAMLESVDISSFSFNKLYAATSVFEGCCKLKYVYCNQDLSKKTDLVSKGMFEGCTSLPHFNSAKVDKTYAYPDNGTTGYFTKKV